jgi:hypothetical protein
LPADGSRWRQCAVSFGALQNNVASPFFEHIQAALVRAHMRIMPAYGHQSSCHYQRSASPSFPGYRGGMPKATRRRKSRDGKTEGDRNKLALTAESALPP